MIDPAGVCLFVPAGLKDFKQRLFDRIGDKIIAAGGQTIRGDLAKLNVLPDDVIPIVGAAPYLLPLVQGWRARNRTWIGWDRGYVRRVFATWLPRGEAGGYYRWTINRYQMGAVRDVPDDRWKQLIPGNSVDPRALEVLPWRNGGRHVVVALPSQTYARSHDGADTWTEETLRQLGLVTDRQIVVRDKETKRPLQADLDGAHCLVSHGSIAAIEAVILGCPVVVDRSCAAALVGLTDLTKIETPVYPDREPWVRSLAYSQFNERELVDGTLFRLIS